MRYWLLTAGALLTLWIAVQAWLTGAPNNLYVVAEPGPLAAPIVRISPDQESRSIHWPTPGFAG